MKIYGSKYSIVNFIYQLDTNVCVFVIQIMKDPIMEADVHH